MSIQLYLHVLTDKYVSVFDNIKLHCTVLDKIISIFNNNKLHCKVIEYNPKIVDVKI